MWIEEAICGAYSIYAIRAMSETEGPLKDGAQEYLHNCLNDYRPDEIDADWFCAGGRRMDGCGRKCDSCATPVYKQYQRSSPFLKDGENAPEAIGLFSKRLRPIGQQE
jgi:hypothetical protein